MTARGIRNNNPGNIKRGSRWNGLMPSHRMSEAQRAEDIFCVFSYPWWGIRAIVRTLITYKNKYRLRSVDSVIKRWAPSGADNNHTEEYIQFVCRRTGLGRHDTFDIENFAMAYKVVEAICFFENGGHPYDCEIQTGIILAGVEP